MLGRINNAEPVRGHIAVVLCRRAALILPKCICGSWLGLAIMHLPGDLARIM